MEPNKKIAALYRIYDLYDDFIRNRDRVCKKYCSCCCTRHVTLTTLEGYAIVRFLVSDKKTDLFHKVKKESHQKRFQPQITTNRLADLCSRGQELPEETMETPVGVCPLLQDDQCSIYPVRPFGCRCMISETDCRDTGYAQMDPFVFTVNNIFLQYIEHIDVQGGFGNLADVLIYLESDVHRKEYRLKGLKNSKHKLIPNLPATVVPVPPEHRRRAQPLLKMLRSIEALCDVRNAG